MLRKRDDTATNKVSFNSALDALKELYENYWKELCYSLHKRFGQGPPDPEDIAQSAFLKYVDHSESNHVDNPKAFIYRSACNLIIDHHRSPKNAAVPEYAYTPDKYQEKSSAHSPENVFMTEQEISIVSNVLTTLPERDRAFVLMNRLDGKSYTDIAREAGMSRSGVQKIITLALKKCTVELARQHTIQNQTVSESLS